MEFGRKKLSVCFNIKFPVKKNKGLKNLIGMGCICSKGAKDEHALKESKKPSKKVAASSSKEEAGLETENEFAEKSRSSTPGVWEEGSDKSMGFEKSVTMQIQAKKGVERGEKGLQPQMCRAFSTRNGIDGAQVVAGWPSWLTAVAGEAIKGWIPRRADSFEKLDKIGQGTYSNVYRALDLETGKIVALKKVRFVNMDPESVRFMAREILILRRLDHPNVMKLEGLVTSRASGSLYLVFEYMEHDLSGLATSPSVRFTESQIKCYMQQLLRGLEHCHSRGVLHRDIKGSNLLIDNNGNLKIGDFGLATFFRVNQKQPLTSRVVTLWYRPPELLLGATDYGVAVDLWSSGCILAELFEGKPIMPGKTEVEQLHKIFKLCGSPSEEYWKKSKLPNATIFKPQQPYRRCVADTFKDFPPSALALLESLLAFESENRGTSTSALQSEFFTTKPLPCDPSLLPKYPPCKEFDAKVREEEERRQKGLSSKGGAREASRKSSKDSKAVGASDANAALPASIQKCRGQTNSKSNTEQYNLEEDRGARHNGHALDVVNERSHLGFHAGLDSTGYREFNTHRSFKPQPKAGQLSRFSNSVAARGSSHSHLDFSRETSAHPCWPDRRHAGFDQQTDAESSNHLLGGPDTSGKINGHVSRKEAYAMKNSRMHYSGPLIPHGGNVDEMLKEHEKQIQIAVRKARIDKDKGRKGGPANGQPDSLLGRYFNNGH